MPNDKIIQFNNQLYFGDNITQIPQTTQLNDTLLYCAKKVIPVENLDIQNGYTINMVTIPDGYNLYIGTISSVFVGNCTSIAGGTSGRVSSNSITYQLEGFTQTSSQPSSNSYPPFNVNIGVSFTIYPYYGTNTEYAIYNGIFTSLTYKEVLSVLPKEYIATINYRYSDSITITGSFITELNFLMYKIA